ncbi:unnamed protein product [Victoria cruziana]
MKGSKWGIGCSFGRRAGSLESPPNGNMEREITAKDNGEASFKHMGKHLAVVKTIRFAVLITGDRSPGNQHNDRR